MENYIKNAIPIENVCDLPKYPIPVMGDVLDRYLDWVSTLVNDEEFEIAKESVVKFKGSDDAGKLENKIRELGNREHDSWIFDYWVKCHLDVRAPLSPHTNVPIIYENQDLLEYDPLQRIAILIHAVSKSYLDFRQNGAEKYRVGKKEYSSDQFTGLLAAINHIQQTTDEYYINPEISDFIVFSYRNHFYKIRTIEEESVVPAEVIFHALEEIVAQSEAPMVPNANYVTIEVDRDRAGILMERILEHKQNQEAYQGIKDAIFVFNYDESEPGSIVENLDHATYDPTYVNRWHGKAPQFTCAKNGVISFIADHCFVDGGTELLLVMKVKEIIDHAEFDFSGSRCVGEYEGVQFLLDDEISAELIKSKDEFDQCMGSFQTKVFNLDGISREQVRSHGVLSGDGFMHLAFQAAQMMTYGEVHNTYISVDNRRFFRGRTECNRPVSRESVAFAKAMTDGDLPADRFKELLFDGLNEHHRRTKLCQNGDGVNRYFHVLESVYHDFGEALEIEKRPMLFDTKAYKTIGYNRLSTTSFTHENMKYLYFPPVVDDGLGIYYLLDDSAFAVVTAYNDYADDLEQFVGNLESCLKTMMEKLSE